MFALLFILLCVRVEGWGIREKMTKIQQCLLIYFFSLLNIYFITRKCHVFIFIPFCPTTLYWKDWEIGTLCFEEDFPVQPAKTHTSERYPQPHGSGSRRLWGKCQGGWTWHRTCLRFPRAWARNRRDPEVSNKGHRRQPLLRVLTNRCVLQGRHRAVGGDSVGRGHRPDLFAAKQVGATVMHGAQGHQRGTERVLTASGTPKLWLGLTNKTCAKQGREGH